MDGDVWYCAIRYGDLSFLFGTCGDDDEILGPGEIQKKGIVKKGLAE